MKRWATWATVWVLVSCVTPVFSQWLPGQGPQKSAPAAKAEENTTNFLEKFVVSPATEKEFAQAVRKGDVATVKRLVEKYLWKPFLTTKIYDNNKKLANPVCVAAANGRTDLLKYMHTYHAKAFSLECEGGNAFDAALNAKQVDTAILLMNLKVPTSTEDKPALAKVAKTITDVGSLKKIIPALLNSGEQATDINIDKHYSINGDAWYEAAGVKNVNFITALQSELKKRGQTAVSKVITWSCPGWSYESAQRWEKNFREGEMGRFLTQHNVKISYDVWETWYGCD